MNHPILSHNLLQSTVVSSCMRIILDHSGNYTCLAENPAGSATYTAALRVKGEICQSAFSYFSIQILNRKTRRPIHRFLIEAYLKDENFKAKATGEI